VAQHISRRWVTELALAVESQRCWSPHAPRGFQSEWSAETKTRSSCRLVSTTCIGCQMNCRRCSRLVSSFLQCPATPSCGTIRSSCHLSRRRRGVRFESSRARSSCAKRLGHRELSR
jgi:hypothetical protein